MKKDHFNMHHDASPIIFENAKMLRAKMTKPEFLIWEYLKTKPQGCKFRRQHPIASYILDFYCHSRRISIEIDGQNHLQILQKEIDLERTQYLNSHGIKELRFQNDEVINDINSVIEYINKELSENSPLGAGLPASKQAGVSAD